MAFQRSNIGNQPREHVHNVFKPISAAPAQQRTSRRGRCESQSGSSCDRSTAVASAGDTHSVPRAATAFSVTSKLSSSFASGRSMRSTRWRTTCRAGMHKREIFGGDLRATYCTAMTYRADVRHMVVFYRVVLNTTPVIFTLFTKNIGWEANLPKRSFAEICISSRAHTAASPVLPSDLTPPHNTVPQKQAQAATAPLHLGCPRQEESRRVLGGLLQTVNRGHLQHRTCLL